MKIISFGLCSLARSCGLMLAQTQPAAPSPPTAAQMAAHQVSMLTQLLSLTADQQKQATALFTTAATTEASAHTAMDTARKALQTAIEANDSAGIASATTKIGELTAQQIQSRATADAALYAILTPDQQTKFAATLSHGPGFGPPGRGHGPMGGPGGPPPGE